MGLDVAVQPSQAKRSLPPQLAYTTLDLTRYANRGLKDDVPDDGKGGWTDQGANVDLRTFPTGKQVFGGVPFDIGAEPKCCIVLKSDSRPGKEGLPASVTIPVGQTVEGLCFLHSAAYTNKGQIGLYQIVYQDGSTTDIPLIHGENLRDWADTPSAFTRERTTQSRVAWTGTTKVFPVVCVYQMLWVNPRPDAAIKEVKFSNPSAACPVLMGITLVTGSKSRDPAATAKAQDLYDKALLALRDGKDKEALAQLRSAVELDNANHDAYQALAQLYEKTKDVDAALSAYQAWAAAGARTPLPFNRIGEILEGRKDFKKALEAYTRSLEIEWNQPPIILAKSRLEKVVNQK
jgi:hypothetical protein